MPDQATELRKMVLAAPRETLAGAGSPPRLLVLTGAMPGVGTSTIAVNLAVALAEHGARVVLVDAGLERADAASLCGIEVDREVSDPPYARRDIHEELRRGPAGIQVVPAVCSPVSGAGTAWSGQTEKAQYRLLRQLKSLGRHAEWVLLDVGRGQPDVLRRYWQAADEVLMVTTPDNPAVLEAYATFKSLLADPFRPVLRVLVNRTTGAAQASDVYGRLEQSCQRFLGRQLHSLGHVPADEAVAEASQRRRPVLSVAASSPAATAIVHIASRILTESPDSGDRGQRGVA